MDSKNVETQRYHIKCRRDLFNKYACVTLNQRVQQRPRMSKREERDDIFALSSGISACTASSSTGSSSVLFLYNNVYILCNQPGNLISKNPKTTRKRYRVPDNCTEDKFAQDSKGSQWRMGSRSQWPPGRDQRLGSWETLYHFRCNLFLKPVVITPRLKLSEGKQMRMKILFSMSYANG